MNERLQGALITVAVIIVVVIGVILGNFVANQWLARDIDTAELVVVEETEDPVVEETVEELVEDQSTSRDEILASDPPGPYPILSGGAVTWQDVYVTALDWPEYAEALFKQGSVNSWEELAEMAEGGQHDTIHTLKKGTRIVNSYYKNGKIRFGEEVLDRDRLVLHNLRGKPAILVSCGNPIRILPEPKPEPKPEPTPTPPSPPPTPPPPTPPPPTFCDPGGGPGPSPNGGTGCAPAGGPGADPS